MKVEMEQFIRLSLLLLLARVLHLLGLSTPFWKWKKQTFGIICLLFEIICTKLIFLYPFDFQGF